MNSIPGIGDGIKLVEFGEVIRFKAVLMECVELIGPEEDRFQNGDLLTDDRDEISRLDVELIECGSVAVIHRL